MLSALAKYIFGGVMGDAPETTPMQYETREMNDWLLVDMPDQAIDDEDMDSESDDDDDILSAVPLLMDEEAFAYSQQIVLSYEANSVCDNTYSRTRKDIRDKIHSASPKVQVHSGDKIQGNFLKNIETLSVETEGTSQIKAHTNSTKLQGNSKSKRSKSKKSKSTKRFRKNKIQDGKDAKLKDIPTAAKENTDNVQENSTDVPKGCHKATQAVGGTIPDSSVTDNVSKIEDFVVPVKENSIDVFQDADTEFHDNKVQEHLLKTQQEIDYAVKSKSSNVTKANSEGGNVIELTCDTKNLSTTEDIQVQNLLDCKDRRQKESDDQVTFEGNIQRDSLELKGNSSKSKKLTSKPKRFRKNKIQNNKDVKVIKDTPTAAKANSNNVQENSNDAQKDFYETPQLVKCKIPDSSVNNNKIRDVSKIKDIVVPLPKNTTDIFQDVGAKFHHKTQQNIDNKVKSDFSEVKDSNNEAKTMPKEENAEVFSKPALNSKDLHAADDAHCDDKIQKSLDDMVTFEGKIQCNSSELKGNSSKSKKLRSKKSKKSKTHHTFYKTQSTIEVAQGDCSAQENTNDTDNNIQVIPSEVSSKFDDETGEAMDVCFGNTQENTEAFLKDIMEDFYEFQENIDKKLLFTSPNTESVQFDYCDVQDPVHEVVEMHSVHDLENKETDILENNNCEFSEKSAEVSERVTSMSNEVPDNYTEDAGVSQEQVQSKIQDVYSKDVSNDSELEGFGDFWDIYTKFLGDSEDEVIEISDEEMDENFGVEMQASDNEMDESSDNETYSATDDDVSENSYFNETERRLLQLTDNWDGKRFLQRFPVTPQEESDEECDDNAFLGTKGDKFNSAVNWPVKNFYNLVPRSQQRIFFTYKTPQTFELTECFQFEPEHSLASQSLYYPSSYALAIAQLNPDHYQCQKERQHNSHRNNTSTLKHKKRMVTKKQASNNATIDPSVIINTELQIIINQLKPTVSVLPTKSAVVLEHVKELKPVQQAMQLEARKYLTRSQLNRQNRNYIYQSSVKTNRRRNLQRNPSGANNNRKCY